MTIVTLALLIGCISMLPAAIDQALESYESNPHGIDRAEIIERLNHNPRRMP